MKPCRLLLTTGSRRWLVCLLLFVVSWNVQARITHVSFAPNEAAKCMEAGLPAIAQGGKAHLRIMGSWTDWTRSVKATRGVSGRVLRTNAVPSWVDVELQAAAHADIGQSQVTLGYPISKDIFNVMVLERQQVDSVRVMQPSEQTFRYINLLISGRHLETAITPQITLVISNAGERSILADGTLGGRVIQSRFIRQSSSQGRLEIEFFQPMTQAVIAVQLRSEDLQKSCRPLQFRTKQPIVARGKQVFNQHSEILSNKANSTFG